MNHSTSKSAADWPPLIPFSHAPWPRRVRDVLFTCLAWLVLVWFMRDLLLVSLALVNQPRAAAIADMVHRAVPPALGRVLSSPEVFWGDFRSYAYVAALFVLWLCAWGWWNRKELGMHAPEAGKLTGSSASQPAALNPAQQFNLAGLPESSMVSWHHSRRLLVDVDETGQPSNVVGSDGRLDGTAGHREKGAV